MLDEQARDQIQRSQQKLRQLEGDIKELRARIAVLSALMSQVMGITPEKMAAILDEQVAKLAAAKTSAELAKETVVCPQCGRPIHKGLKQCQICGAPAPPLA